jgi:hypothetical protein
MKVAINKCFGGFGLSEQAIERLIELGMTVGGEGDDCEITKFSEKATLFAGGQYYIRDNYTESFRSDPRVVQVIEELGDAANGQFARIKIVEIPDGISWQINEYDGQESIAETHRSWG